MEYWLSILIEVLSWASFIAGGFFLVVGAVGLIRLPDFWARLHAAGIIDTAGAGLVILGMMLQAGLSLVALKLLLIGVFIFIASPTATHAIAHAAFAAGLRPTRLGKDASGRFHANEEAP